MKLLSRNRMLWVLGSFAIFLFVVSAYAGQGYGPASGPYGWGHHRYSGYYQQNLTEEQVKRIQEERDVFYSATSELRDQLYQKELAMRAELAKDDPEVAKLKEIQKEISRIEARMDDKWIEHVIEMKKINPRAGKGYYGCPRGKGYGPGHGYHHGRHGGYRGGPGLRACCRR